MTDQPRILIVAEHASARFGGEAALPLHYFRVLRGRDIPVWLITHARTRDELSQLYPDDEQIIYIEDNQFHRLMWQLGKHLPAQIGYFTVGFLSRLSTQLAQRRRVKELVRDQHITVIHQPMPVSPREPSMLFGFGVPVVIGPMNGGMDYPPAFRRQRSAVERTLIDFGRAGAAALNWMMPGKRRAALLLVANQRTREALPKGVCRHVLELVENGVDLSLWRSVDKKMATSPASTLVLLTDAVATSPVTFAFMGRLVDWKAVDLLLHAFAEAHKHSPMRLWILGDGNQRQKLEALAAELGIKVNSPSGEATGGVTFTGWLAQSECAGRLQRADCLVLPSLLECGGAVVLEAMSMAKPVIATAWGGPLDYLDASCGVLIEPTDRSSLVTGIAQAMVRLARNPVEREAMGMRGREKVISDYDWNVKVDSMLRLYTQLRAVKIGAA